MSQLDCDRDSIGIGIGICICICICIGICICFDRVVWCGVVMAIDRVWDCD